MTIKDAPPPSSTLPVSAGGPSNQATLAGEAPPPAYTVSPIYQGLGFSSSHANPPSASTPFFPPPPAVAAQRARQRFFKALVVAFLIWVFVGAIFGGGIEDMSEERGRRDRHGRYPPPPRITYYQEAVPIAQPVASEVVASSM